MNFSSLWCIKDRDPKQVERKVLSFQRHYSIPPPVSRPDLQIFGFCFLFFISYLLGPFRAGVRGCVLGCGEERSLYIYAFSIISAFFFPLCSGPLRRLRRHGCGALLLLRASLRPRKRQTAAPAPLRLFHPQDVPQLRSPARVGGSPLSLAALAGVSPALPEGEPSVRPWAKENFVVRRSFFSFALPQTLPKLTQVRLPPPAGEVAQRLAL